MRPATSCGGTWRCWGMGDQTPEDWKRITLSSMARVVSGGTPARDVPGYWDGNIPWVTPTDITGTRGRYLNETDESITKNGLASCSARLLSADTILMTSRATVGEARIAAREVCTNQGFKSLVVNKGVDSLFLYYQMQRCREAYKLFGIGSTFLEVNKKDTEQFKLLLPNLLEEQKGIARILDTIDSAIEKTESLIDKYQQIKAGLMHDLFTRGVTPDGKLRPPREQAPELYQETPIGWIPKEWVFATCARVCEKIIDCKNRTPPETPDGYPVIRTPNVRNGEFVDKELLHTDATSYELWTARGKPQPGDIVITREAPVGEVYLIPERHPEACLGQRMMLYRPNPAVINPVYFLYALQSRQIQNRLDLISGGSTVGHVRVGDIRELWMFMPESVDEQNFIASCLLAASKKIEVEKGSRYKLQQKKNGLMHDLLTGKVRVKVEEPSKEAIHA